MVGVVGRVGAAFLAASVVSRRWHRTWGADDREAHEPLPGDELVPEAELQTTRAITIAASPAEVWPWLVQMGQGRGGLYTYEWIENALGAQIHNLDRIDPALQALRVGDRIRLTPEVYLGRIPGQYYLVKDSCGVARCVQLSRGGRSRTGDLVLPKHARYQAAPRPEWEKCTAG